MMIKSGGIYQLDCFDGVTLGFSGREFDLNRRDEFLKGLSIAAEDLVLLRQVHSANLVLVTAEKKPGRDCPADGMLTRVPGIALGILTADCVPIFFWDPARKAVGIAHAGWRGVYQGIAKKTVQAFRQNFLSRSEDIRVAIGPAIRKCCYEVGHEFEDFFPEFYARPKEEGHNGVMDLVAAVRNDLLAEGITGGHIHDTGLCTACQNEEFYSYRREKETPERILSVICLRPAS
ncbi:MAG TPA: peptidoglycan editing factor PgeF [Verrucomicrobiae bacterium]|jgi:YfiH family protein|nr:peptidoglycan editing factor PgeF [Verrucomicrobiae bacterium]